MTNGRVGRVPVQRLGLVLFAGWLFFAVAVPVAVILPPSETKVADRLCHLPYICVDYRQDSLTEEGRHGHLAGTS